MVWRDVQHSHISPRPSPPFLYPVSSSSSPPEATTAPGLVSKNNVRFVVKNPWYVPATGERNSTFSLAPPNPFTPDTHTYIRTYIHTAAVTSPSTSYQSSITPSISPSFLLRLTDVRLLGGGSSQRNWWQSDSNAVSMQRGLSLSKFVCLLHKQEGIWGLMPLCAQIAAERRIRTTDIINSQPSKVIWHRSLLLTWIFKC